MTVTTTANSITYVGNGVTRVFAFPYIFFKPTDLVVTLTTTASGLVITPPSVLNGGASGDYTVSGVVEDGEYAAGGTVTFNSAPAGGVTVSLLRDVPAIQDVELIDNTKFPADTVNVEFDKLTVLSQDLEHEIDGINIEIDDLRDKILAISPLTADVYATQHGLSETNTPEGNVTAINAAIVEGANRRVRTIVSGGVYDIAGQINPVSGSHLVFEPNTVLRPVGWSTNGTVIGNLQPVDNVTVEGVTMDFAGYPASPYGLARQGTFTQEATAAGVTMVPRTPPLTGSIMTIAGAITGTLRVGQAIFGIGVDLAPASYIASITVNPTTGVTEYFVPSTQTVSSPVSIRAFGSLIQLEAADPITSATATNPSRLIYLAGGTNHGVQARGISTVDDLTKVVRVNVPWFNPTTIVPATISGTTLTVPAAATFTATGRPDPVNNPTWITVAGTVGTLYQRARITGGGIDGTLIVVLSQFISGTPGGNGVWRTSVQIPVGGGTITADTANAWDVGLVVHGEGVLEETRITVSTPGSNILTVDKSQTVGPTTMRGIQVPADNPSAFPPTRYQWGWNDNVMSFGGGASNVRIMRTLGYNMKGDQFQQAGGKIINFEQGVENSQIIDTIGIGDPQYPPVACVFVQGRSGVFPSGQDRDATQIIVDRVFAQNFAAAIMIGSADTTEELPGNPEQLLVIANNIEFRNCGHAPLRMVGAGAYQQKSGPICLFRNQNTIVTNVNGYNSPDYPDTFPGYPTDFPERVGFGLSGPIGAVIWGYGRNTYVGNVSYHGSADALVQINRARAMGEDAGPSGRPENVFDFKIDNLRHYNGNISRVLAIDPNLVGRITDADMKISLRAELSITSTMTATTQFPTPGIVSTELNGYTGSMVDVVDATSKVRVIGTPDQIFDAGNTFASFPSGMTLLDTNQFIAGHLRVGGAASVVPTAFIDVTGTAASAPLRIRHGVAPTTPQDGDMWTTTVGAFVRINGVTKTFTLT